MRSFTNCCSVPPDMEHGTRAHVRDVGKTEVDAEMMDAARRTSMGTGKGSHQLYASISRYETAGMRTGGRSKDENDCGPRSQTEEMLIVRKPGRSMGMDNGQGGQAGEKVV